MEPGNIIFGSGITAGDRPVVFPITGNIVGMVFQDGDLSYSQAQVTLPGAAAATGEWITNNLQIANVTDNVYSVTTDGTNSWVLSVSGTTATNFYSCCTADFAETQVDADAGANGQDGISDIDMYCVTSTDCKIVYTDDIDAAAPTLIFVDCDNEACSSKTVTTLDSDIGAAGDQAGPSIFCVDDGDGIVSDNCKIVYGDNMNADAGGDTTPNLLFIDCTNDGTCASKTSTEIDSGLGTNAAVVHTSIYCPSDTNCKFVYNDSGAADFFFVDCPDAACTATDRVITGIDTGAGAQVKSDLDCSPGSSNCKMVYTDGGASAWDLVFTDCTADEDCSTNTDTIIDTDIGTTIGAQPVSIDCLGQDLDCKFVYGDQTAGDLFFVDCPDATCTATGRTITSVDAAGGANTLTATSAYLDCVAAGDCKFTYVGNLTSGSEQLYFVDCDDAGGLCTSGSVVALPGPRFQAALKCVDSAGAASSTNCKFAYYEGTAATQPTVMFTDCDVTNCFPTSTDEPDPWTGQTNVTSVSLSLQTASNTLYAHIIKDTNEKAYFISSDKTTISWINETDYGWSGSGNHLGHINSPITGTADTQIAVVLRETNNYEFATLPERALFLLGAVPFLPKVFGKLRKKKERGKHFQFKI